MNSYPLISTRIKKNGDLEVWIMKSVSSKGATYQVVGKISKALQERAVKNTK